MIAVKNLVKDYEDGGFVTHAVCGVSFEIQKGEFVAIMGPSGSGKSTLMHVLSFLDRPTSGFYAFLGRNVSELSDIELAAARNKNMGFVFQSFNLLGRSSVYENVEMPLLYSSALLHQRGEMVKNAVSAVGLLDKLYQEAGKLSGGQKQRVAIARALVNEPEIIFADEPTGNLDSESGAQVMEILNSLNKAGRTVILVTHETYTAAYAQRTIRLRDGLVESDKISGKIGKPAFFK